MKFKVSSTSFYNKLQNISRVQSNKNSLKILESILFDLQDDTLSMTASDSETVITTNIKVSESEGGGLFSIDSKTLINSIKEISDQPITFIIDESSNQVEVQYKNGQFRITSTKAEDYPIPVNKEENDHELYIPADILQDTMQHTIFAAADDDLRPHMNGILFELSPEKLTVVGTDGHKLVRMHLLTVNSDCNLQVILPKKPANLIKSILPKDDEEICFKFNERSAKITTSEYTVTCRLIEGVYPNWEGVIPVNCPFHMRVDRLALLSALRRVSLFGDAASSLIKVQIEDNSITVSAKNIEFSTSAEESINCDYNGNPISIGFKVSYFIEVLANLTGQEVIFELTDQSRPTIILPAEQNPDTDLLSMVMPMMLPY